MKVLIIAAIALHSLLVGCTSVNVTPVPAEHRISTVLIKENPKVAVADFLDVLVDGFERHNINAQVVPATTDTGDAYTVTYVAYRKWDMAPYLVDATINIHKDKSRIAHAKYHLKGGGGFSPMKWQGTNAKIDPVIDELLTGIKSPD